MAEADGFKPFHPEFPQNIYHFTRWQNGLKAAFTFDPAEANLAALQEDARTAGTSWSARCTRRRAEPAKRSSTSACRSGVARWHRHVNLCFPPKGQGATADWTKFGFNGSIATKAACDTAGGRFYPQVFGWMVHVYPWATTQETAWAH